MRISDEITAYILRMMEDAENGAAELRRNELAEELGCVPSQITYVLTSRFTPQQGYVVESRRGGGGYIRVRRVTPQQTATPLMHIVNAIENELVPAAAEAILQSMVYQGCLKKSAAAVMAAALSDRALRDVPVELRDRVRASLLKHMLAAYL
ncbi:MAG: CtsR family transcriptional regulator [Clostridia bacterium]|nr:CtsR family transcriptional regulator [Clostridia bacterium]